jgi:hypothetical protein
MAEQTITPLQYLSYSIEPHHPFIKEHNTKPKPWIFDLKNPKEKVCLKSQLLNKSPNFFKDGLMNNDAKNLH